MILIDFDHGWMFFPCCHVERVNFHFYFVTIIINIINFSGIDLKNGRLLWAAICFVYIPVVLIKEWGSLIDFN